jgi:hypothetical protein
VNAVGRAKNIYKIIFILFQTEIVSRSGVFGMATRLGAEKSGVRIPVEARDFSLLKRSRSVVGPN